MTVTQRIGDPPSDPRTISHDARCFEAAAHADVRRLLRRRDVERRRYPGTTCAAYARIRADRVRTRKTAVATTWA